MRAALAFLTVLGGARTPDGRATRWFPVVGALLGGLLAAVAWGADQWWPPVVVAAVVVAVDLGVTGLLHADGLADTADGLLAPLDRDRRLAVMRAPETGAFALAVVPSVLLLRAAGLAVGPDHWAALAAVWGASRTVIAVVPAVVPYARPGGLAGPFVAGAALGHAAWFVPAGAALWLTDGPRGLVALGVLVGVSAAVVALARRRLGGFTGDVLGAVVLLGETGALLALAARP